MDDELYRLIVDSSVDYAIFHLGLDGIIQTWNPGAERIFGYTAEEVIGRHGSLLFVPEDVFRAEPEREMKFASETGRAQDSRWHLRKDGTRFWANVVITALPEGDGALRGFAKVTRDITERRAHEQRIEQLSRELQARVAQLDSANRELARKNSEIESFVYSVSHDLRAPLVNLQGFSQELALTRDALKPLIAAADVPADVQRQATALLDGELSESIAFIRNAVRHLGSIIDGLLRLSRAGRIEYEFAPVHAGAVVADILSSMHSTVVESGARVEVRPLPVVHADRNALGQVFANLIDNAMKNLDRSRPGVVEISASADTPPVFAVRDNGVGIVEEYRPKIFRVFQHVHGRHPAGEGMGLAIVHRIVERHGGRIWFESTPGAGTAFFFTLGSAASSAAPAAGG